MAITTVTKEISKSEIGLTSCHEHIFIKLLKTFEEPQEANRTNLFNQKISLENLHYLIVDFTCMRDNFIVGNIEIAEKELKEFKKVGGKTIIDPTTIDLGRDVVALRSLSRLLDINIITTTGFYREAYNIDMVENMTVDDICKNMVKEIKEGIGDTGIKAGMIGELGSAEDVSNSEEKVLTAAAIAQKDTGVPIMVHFEPWQDSFFDNFLKITNILEKNGANLKKVCICHLSHGFYDYKYLKNICDRGVYVGFDDFGEPCLGPINEPSDIHKMERLLKLVEDGYVKQILTGNDVCLKTRLQTYGGLGYNHFIGDIIPLLRKRGLLDSDVADLLSNNPAEFLDVP